MNLSKFPEQRRILPELFHLRCLLSEHPFKLAKQRFESANCKGSGLALGSGG
jgi:hypothetical protein